MNFVICFLLVILQIAFPILQFNYAILHIQRVDDSRICKIKLVILQNIVDSGLQIAKCFSIFAKCSFYIAIMNY